MSGVRTAKTGIETDRDGASLDSLRPYLKPSITATRRNNLADSQAPRQNT